MDVKEYPLAHPHAHAAAQGAFHIGSTHTSSHAGTYAYSHTPTFASSHMQGRRMLGWH